jgi:hypothetical protein
MAAILFEAATGLLVTFAPFAASVQWSVLLHTVVGLLLLVPVTWYTLIHWLDYKRYNLSDAVLLGYVGGVALLLCAASGVVIGWCVAKIPLIQFEINPCSAMRIATHSAAHVTARMAATGNTVTANTIVMQCM